MGFNKRYFDAGVIAKIVENQGWEYLERILKNTEIFIFDDAESSKIVELLSEKKVEEAKQILKDYVLRISTKTSSHNRRI